MTTQGYNQRFYVRAPAYICTEILSTHTCFYAENMPTAVNTFCGLFAAAEFSADTMTFASRRLAGSWQTNLVI